MKFIARAKHQRGITTVEFALIGSVLFIVLFGLIEFGRLLFTWNVLDEATRRAARLAAVCPPFDGAGPAFVSLKGSFDDNMLPGFTSANIALSYLQEDGVTSAAATQDTYYVRAAITGYQHQMLIPFFDITLDALDFSTTLPAESLGVHPDGTSPNCT